MKLIIITIVLIATPLLAQELATTGTSSDNEGIVFVFFCNQFIIHVLYIHR